MTCIAFDGRFLVADGRTTTSHGSILSERSEKIFRIGDKLVGVSGAAYAIEGLLAFVEQGCHFKDYPEYKEGRDGFSCIVIDLKGKGTHYDTYGAPSAIDPPFAIGAGGEYAMGAMAQGANAEQAVRIAQRFESSVGAPHQIFDLITLYNHVFNYGKSEDAA